MPTHALEKKACLSLNIFGRAIACVIVSFGVVAQADYLVDAGLLPQGKVMDTLRTIDQERGKERLTNDALGEEEAVTGERGRASEAMSRQQMQDELDRRIELMKSGSTEGRDSDQQRS